MADATHYVSTSPTYTGGKHYAAGVPFVWTPSEVEETDGEGKTTKAMTKPSGDWTPVPASEAAIIETATEKVPDDADLDALTKAPLQAVAFMRRVSGIADLDVDGLRDAIRASYEPAL